jgi:hypothetical protein
MLPEFFTSEMVLLPTYLAHHHLLALDYNASTIRSVNGAAVTTIAGSTGGRQWPREGKAHVAHLPNLGSVTAFSPRSVVASDIYGSIILLSDEPNGGGQYFRVWTGFRALLPSASAAMLTGPQTMSSLPVNPGSKPTQGTKSDFELRIFDSSWPLHRAILELRAPGLLLKDVTERIEANEWLVKEDMDALIRTIYLDEWRRLAPAFTNKSIEVLGRRYCAALEIGCTQFVASVEEEIQDCFRVSCQMFDSFLDDAEDVNLVNFVSPAPSKERFTVPQDTLSILELIVSLSKQHNEVAATKMLSLFLPYMVSNYPGGLGSVTVPNWSHSLSDMPALVAVVREHIKQNRFHMPKVRLLDYHEDWVAQWRGLLTSYPKHLATVLIQIDSLNETSLQPNLQIHGEERIWNVHRWILATKSPFFESLFASHFVDSKAPSWYAPCSDTDPGYLSDAAMEAFLDYIYTDDPTLIIELPSSDYAQVVDAFPFYFVQDAPHHLLIIE